MKCKALLSPALGFAAIIVCASLSLRCDESLPVYVFPDRVLSLKVSLIEQLNDHEAPPEHQMMHLVLIGQNIFDEVFQDSVDIHGSVKVVWKRKPTRHSTISLTSLNLTDESLIVNGKMTLLPGQQFALNVYWNLTSDDGIYLPFEMNFSNTATRLCGYNTICSDPEDFEFDASLLVFDRIGTIKAPPKDFQVVGKLLLGGGG